MLLTFRILRDSETSRLSEKWFNQRKTREENPQGMRWFVFLSLSPRNLCRRSDQYIAIEVVTSISLLPSPLFCLLSPAFMYSNLCHSLSLPHRFAFPASLGWLELHTSLKYLCLGGSAITPLHFCLRTLHFIHHVFLIPLSLCSILLLCFYRSLEWKSAFSLSLNPLFLCFALSIGHAPYLPNLPQPEQPEHLSQRHNEYQQ